MQGPARRTTEHADTDRTRTEEEERRFDPGTFASTASAGPHLLQLSGRVGRQNADGAGGGEPGVRASAQAASGPEATSVAGHPCYG